MFRNKSIAIFLSYVDYTDYRRKEQQSLAFDILAKAPSHVQVFCLDFCHSSLSKDIIRRNIIDKGITYCNCLKRDSSEIIGNSRSLPYIKEILDRGNETSNYKYNVIGYINSDILISNLIWNDILQRNYDAFILSRSDIAEISYTSFLKNDIKVIYGGDKHAGVDGFFFKRLWWNKNRHLFPCNLVVGETEWDTCYRHIIKRYCKKYYEGRHLYHVYHDQRWTLDSAGAKLNTHIWESIKND